MHTIWITGASSGIGAACAASVPYPDAHVVGVSRRPSAGRGHLSADLSQPVGWSTLRDSFRAELVKQRGGTATLLHLAGTTDPVGDVAEVDEDDYTSAVLLNAAAGPVLAQAFLASCAANQVHGTVVLCGSPAGSDVVAGLSHYGAGKAAQLQWTRTVAAEHGALPAAYRVLLVVPYAVDTPMLRGVMAGDPREVALAGYFAELERRAELATAGTAATHIWEAVASSARSGTVFPVGARALSES